jgi:Cu/Ag efflux protein CusF
MKTNKLLNRTWTALLVPATILAINAAAGQASASPPHQKDVTGIATAIDQQEKTVWVKTFWGTKRLNIADDCSVSLQDKPDATLADLRPGQKLEVNYADSQGVLVAHQIAQRNLTFAGHITANDPARHTITLRGRVLDKTFRIANDCKVMLRDEKAGTLADLQPGNRVTVIYEIPNHGAIARQIAQTSDTFSGTLTAIDLNERTLKAKAFLGSKQFDLADDCSIVISGKPDAGLSDLRLGEKIVLSYDDADGVNIVNRIASAEASQAALTAASGRQEGAEIPMPLP